MTHTASAAAKQAKREFIATNAVLDAARRSRREITAAGTFPVQELIDLTDAQFRQIELYYRVHE